MARFGKVDGSGVVSVLILCVLAGIAVIAFTKLLSPKEVKNPDGVFWMDSLVCTDTGCTMSIRNESEDRLEVLVSRETALFINGPTR